MEHFVPDDAGETVRLAKITEHYNLAIISTLQETLDVFKAVPDLELRSDDVMLCTFPKTVDYGSYSWYLNEWQLAIEEGVGYPLHIMYFEDMKLNGVEELDKLAKFLEVDLTDKLRDEIIEMCSFNKMKKEKRRVEDDIGGVHMNNGFNLFRKGQIGDWKNYFTVAQNEMFDDIWTQEIRNNSMFKFKYSQQTDIK